MVSEPMSAVLERKRKAEHCSGADGVKAYRCGTHRTVDPAATLARVRPYLQGMGITRVANVTGLDWTGFRLYPPADRIPDRWRFPGQRGYAGRHQGLRSDGGDRVYHAERITLPVSSAASRTSSRTHRLIDPTRAAGRTADPYRPAHALGRGRPVDERERVLVRLRKRSLRRDLSAARGKRLASCRSNARLRQLIPGGALPWHMRGSRAGRDELWIQPTSDPERTRIDLATVETHMPRSSGPAQRSRMDRSGCGD